MIEYLLKPQSQRHFTDTEFDYPLARDVEINPLLPQLAEFEIPEVDLSDLGDLEPTLELLREVGAL